MIQPNISFKVKSSDEWEYLTHEWIEYNFMIGEPTFINGYI